MKRGGIRQVKPGDGGLKIWSRGKRPIVSSRELEDGQIYSTNIGYKGKGV